MPHIDIHERILSNGLRVIVCPNNVAPVVTVNVIYHVGSANERRGRTGLAHLFEHLMFDNNQQGEDKVYDKLCTKAGGTNNAYTTYDHTTYYITLPSHQLRAGLWLEAQRMAGCSISEQALITQRNVVIEEIKQTIENQPYMRWSPAMDEAAFSADCTYSWTVIGSADDVGATGMEDVEGFYRRHYSPSNAIICIAGDVDSTSAFTAVEELFGSIPSGAHNPTPPMYSEMMRRRGVHCIVPDQVPLPAVFLAFHMPGVTDERMYDADLAAAFLSSGRRAVLYQDLVVRQQIASEAGVFMDKRALSSLMIYYAYALDKGVTTDQLTEKIQESVSKARLTETDRERVVNRSRTAFAAEHQRSSAIADNVGWSAMFLGDPHHVNRVMDQVAARSLDQIQDVINSTRDLAQAVRVDVVPA